MAEKDGSVAKKANSFAAKVGYFVIILVIGVVIGVAASFFFSGGAFFGKDKKAATAPVSVVFERVQAQNELVCASQKYNITEKAEDSNKIPVIDFEIPLTGNSFWYRYVGNIKAAVNLKNAEFSQKDNVITVSLDQPYISSNTPNMEESGVLEENNNILNPIHVQDVDKLQRYCVETSESKAIEGGLLDEARGFAEQDIRSIFNAALGDGYSVEFNWR